MQRPENLAESLVREVRRSQEPIEIGRGLTADIDLDSVGPAAYARFALILREGRFSERRGYSRRPVLEGFLTVEQQVNGRVAGEASHNAGNPGSGGSRSMQLWEADLSIQLEEQPRVTGGSWSH